MLDRQKIDRPAILNRFALWQAMALLALAALALILVLPSLPSLLNRDGPIKPDSIDFANWLQGALPVLLIMLIGTAYFLRADKFAPGTVMAVAPVVIVGFLASMKFALEERNTAYVRLVGEDSPGEWSGFACLVIAAIFFAAALVRHVRRRDFHRILVLSLWVVATCFAAAEEISYGQRIFGFATPDAYSAENTQGEFNFHNLAYLDKVTQYFIPLALTAYCIMSASRWIPRWQAPRFLNEQIAPLFDVLRAPRWTITWFGAFAVSLLVDYGVRHEDCAPCRLMLAWPDNEIFELMFSFALAATAIATWWAGVSSRTE